MNALGRSKTADLWVVRGDASVTATQMAKRLSMSMDTIDWRGVDPYDGLLSPVARALRGRATRQMLLQAVRRSPLNLRALLRIPPRRMAATTGLAASATARLAGDPFWECQLSRLGRWTAQGQIAHGPHQGLWGYEFDVQTRWGFYAAKTPNVVATSFAAHGCLDAQALRGKELERLGQGLLRNLWRGEFFAYTPQSTVLIHNANLLGAALAGRLSATGQLDDGLRSDLRSAAVMGAGTTLRHQRADGSWPYGDSKGLDWVDGFHTVYNLLSLDRLMWLLESDAEKAIDRGARFYFDHLFRDGIPLYYPDRSSGPSDINNVATGLRGAVWGARRGKVPDHLPGRVFEYLVAAFWDASGYFRAAANRWKPSAKLNFPRWGAAPALDALSTLIAWHRGGSCL